MSNQGETPPRIGPGAADFDAPPAQTPAAVPSVTFRWFHGVAALGVLLTAILPAYLALENVWFRAAGLAAFASVFLALLALVVGGARLAFQKSRPRKVGLALLAMSLGVAALLIAAVAGHWMRSRQVEDGAVILTASMRDYLESQNQIGARRAALLGLLGLPGAALGFLLLVMVLGARRAAPKDIDPKTVAFWPVWVGVFGGAAGILVSLVGVIWASVLTVKEVTHPHTGPIEKTAAAFASADLTFGCDQLELALAPGYAPPQLLDEHLPNRYELSHRCVTVAIDALPKGDGCKEAAERLARSRTVELAGASERARRACER